MSETGTNTIENNAVKFKPPIAEKGIARESIIFNSPLDKDKPAVVKTDPETGRVTAVGENEEEMWARQDKLDKTPMSIADPETGAQTVNPAWLEAKAEALGLTTDGYQKLVAEGVTDVGEYVGKTGRTEEEIKSYEAMRLNNKLEEDNEKNTNLQTGNHSVDLAPTHPEGPPDILDPNLLKEPTVLIVNYLSKYLKRHLDRSGDLSDSGKNESKINIPANIIIDSWKKSWKKIQEDIEAKTDPELIKLLNDLAGLLNKRLDEEIDKNKTYPTI